MADNITQVGNKTLVSKIVYGTPYRTAIISQSADINAISGLDVTGAISGSLLTFDSDTGVWSVSNILTNTVVDGRVYPSDSERSQILIRRSGTQGDPLTLRSGELAYSWLADSASDGYGNGGDRLFIGVGEESLVNGELVAERIEVIGGKYFTNLLNHQHGTLTPSSALIVDSNGRIDEIIVNKITVLDSSFITSVNISGSASLSNLTVQNNATLNNLSVSGTTTLEGVSITQLDVLGSSTFDSAVLMKDSLRVEGDVVVDGSTNIGANLNVSGGTTLDSAKANKLVIVKDFVVDSSANVTIADKTLREFIDSSVFELLVAGQSIIITYNDSANSLRIDTSIATSNNPGVASFDSDQFNIDSTGNVTINQLDGGTF